MSTLIVVHGARQHKSKVTPGTLLSQVLTDACAALALGEPAQYALLHGGAVKKPLDLATPFRLSGLANNVRRSSSSVSVSLTFLVCQAKVVLERRASAAAVRASVTLQLSDAREFRLGNRF